MFYSLYDIFRKIKLRFNGFIFFIIRGKYIKKIGYKNKLIGLQYIKFGKNFSIGDFCWIEAVYKYKGKIYTPLIDIGDDVAISDLTHISAVKKITIGSGCLLGSKIYIGDHTHGSYNFDSEHISVPPAYRELDGIDEIRIGANTWIADGVIILPGADIAPNSVIAANSVCKLKTTKPALIAGVPAKVIRFI